MSDAKSFKETILECDKKIEEVFKNSLEYKNIRYITDLWRLVVNAENYEDIYIHTSNITSLKESYFYLKNNNFSSLDYYTNVRLKQVKDLSCTLLPFFLSLIKPNLGEVLEYKKEKKEIAKIKNEATALLEEIKQSKDKAEGDKNTAQTTLQNINILQTEVTAKHNEVIEKYNDLVNSKHELGDDEFTGYLEYIKSLKSGTEDFYNTSKGLKTEIEKDKKEIDKAKQDIEDYKNRATKITKDGKDINFEEYKSKTHKEIEDILTKANEALGGAINTKMVEAFKKEAEAKEREVKFIFWSSIICLAMAIFLALISIIEITLSKEATKFLSQIFIASLPFALLYAMFSKNKNEKAKQKEEGEKIQKEEGEKMPWHKTLHKNFCFYIPLYEKFCTFIQELCTFIQENFWKITFSGIFISICCVNRNLFNSDFFEIITLRDFKNIDATTFFYRSITLLPFILGFWFLNKKHDALSILHAEYKHKQSVVEAMIGYRAEYESKIDEDENYKKESYQFFEKTFEEINKNPAEKINKMMMKSSRDLSKLIKSTKNNEK